MLVSFRIRHPAYFCLRFGLVDSLNSQTKSVTLGNSHLGRRDTLDATPALTILGQNLAHLFNTVMHAAVVAESSCRHQVFLTGSGGPLGRVGLFVRPRDTEQPAAMVATYARANRRMKRRRFTLPAYHIACHGWGPGLCHSSAPGSTSRCLRRCNITRIAGSRQPEI